MGESGESEIGGGSRKNAGRLVKWRDIKSGSRSKTTYPRGTALLIAVLVCSASVGVVCAGEETLDIRGSTTVMPIAQTCAKIYMDYWGGDIRVSGGGSGPGIRAVGEGLAEIGDASRGLKPEERERYPDLVGTEIARDGVAVIVHPTNPLGELTLEQVRGIYAGKITNWKDIGGPNKRIVAIQREAGSGTRDTFEESVMEDLLVTDRAQPYPSNGAIANLVAQNPNAIGYISIGYLSKMVKGIKLDGVEPTVENVVNGRYPITRSLYMFTKGEPKSLTKLFLNFVLSPEGQKIVGECGYVRLHGVEIGTIL